MMPDIGREERRNKRAPVVAVIAAGTAVASALVQPDWQWVPLAAGMSDAIAVGAGIGRRGRDDDDGPAGAAAHRWHLLVTVSRLMPRSAGRRWLAEAESLLSEITATRRSAAIRSYLLSAPRLVVMMWARKALRQARPGPGRPG
jgi:hypothetical protein